MSDATAFRVYEPSECGADGYPFAWHKGEPSVKDLVRELAGHRCVRCLHPFVCGETPGEWSPCDGRCTHGGSIRSLVDEPPGGPTVARAFVCPSEVRAGAYVKQGWRIEAAWRVLTVHHLTGVKADLRWWNLAALCQRCHLEIQGRVRMEQVYPHEHSDWFKPYAAGYYAATYLGEDLTREQTDDRLDELLALELPQLHPGDQQEGAAA
ncbi:MAG TPA: hypothetical protein VLC07_00930 [Solirubrobacterales bacterium]|nr:hypothetical protein [Solirubrobacterales bacterium]